MGRIARQLRPLLDRYYDRLHDGAIARSALLSHVQGFFAWGTGYTDKATSEWVKFDGLSGNQILLFQALDAFLGIEPYLSAEDLRRNVPVRQRELSDVLQKHSFRHRLDRLTGGESDARILREVDGILKHLRVSLHRYCHCAAIRCSNLRTLETLTLLLTAVPFSTPEAS